MQQVTQGQNIGDVIDDDYDEQLKKYESEKKARILDFRGKVNDLIKQYNNCLSQMETRQVQACNEKLQKIKNFELRRLANFNLSLELAFEKWSNIETYFGANEYSGFTLHYFPYPDEYRQYKSTLLKKKRDEDGTSIFDNL